MWLINIIMIKLKIISVLIIKLKKHFYFQYVKICLWLLSFFVTKNKNYIIYHVCTLLLFLFRWYTITFDLSLSMYQMLAHLLHILCTNFSIWYLSLLHLFNFVVWKPFLHKHFNNRCWIVNILDGHNFTHPLHLYLCQCPPLKLLLHAVKHNDCPIHYIALICYHQKMAFLLLK
jgi:hypothetical protein